MQKTLNEEEASDPCYMYVGNQLVYEPQFAKVFKHIRKRRSTSAFKANYVISP